MIVDLLIEDIVGQKTFDKIFRFTFNTIFLASKTLLVGQIYAPAGDPTRNLMGMILSINIFMNHTVLHNSLIPITTSTFPVNYAVDLNNHDFKVEGARGFHIVSMIWQPAYMYEDHVHLKENNIDMLNMTMRSISK